MRLSWLTECPARSVPVRPGGCLAWIRRSRSQRWPRACRVLVRVRSWARRGLPRSRPCPGPLAARLGLHCDLVLCGGLRGPWFALVTVRWGGHGHRVMHRYKRSRARLATHGRGPLDARATWPGYGASNQHAGSQSRSCGSCRLCRGSVGLHGEPAFSRERAREHLAAAIWRHAWLLRCRRRERGCRAGLG